MSCAFVQGSFSDSKKFKSLWHSEIFVNKGPYGPGNFITLLLVFIRSEPNSMINKAVIRECKVINALAICEKLKVLWHFEILTWGVHGKILKCAIS